MTSKTSRAKKLTLLLPEDIIRVAKNYAKAHSTSISALVTKLFEGMHANQLDKAQNGPPSRASLTASSTGIIRLSKANKADLISEALGTKWKWKKL